MKKLLVMMMVATLSCGMLFAGCGGSEEEQDSTVEADAETDADVEEEAGVVEEVVDDVALAIQADGREYGKTYTLAQTDVMTTAFFQMKINSVNVVEELEEYVPNDGYTFVVVNISVTNTFGSEIPMYDADFALLWGEGEDEVAYPDTDFEDALPAEYNIADGKTTTGNLVYIVPKGQTNFVLEYYDLWDDDFEGNTYDMRIKL